MPVKAKGEKKESTIVKEVKKEKEEPSVTNEVVQSLETTVSHSESKTKFKKQEKLSKLESKTESKAAESKTESKAAESKATQSKTASKTESKTAESKTESKTAESKTESKTAESKTESKTAESKTESKTASKVKSKTSGVAKKESNTDANIAEQNVEDAKVNNTSSVQEEPVNESKFMSQLECAQDEMKKMKDQMHELNLNLKKLESAYTFDIKKALKSSEKKIVRTVKTGFAKPKLVPDKLAKFIGVESGTELTGPEVTKNVWKQLKERNLMYEKDKRVFRTNVEVSEVFNVPKSVNKSISHKDTEGFNFRNIQKYIKNAYKEN